MEKVLVADICSGDVIVPTEPGVYKWWASKDIILDIYNGILKHGNIKEKYTLIKEDVLLDQIEDMKNGNDTLYCFYVGKTVAKRGLRCRIVNNHIKGTRRNSTLRKSLEAVIPNKDILLKCYVTWEVIEREEIGFKEKIQSTEKT